MRAGTWLLHSMAYGGLEMKTRHIFVLDPYALRARVDDIVISRGLGTRMHSGLRLPQGRGLRGSIRPRRCHTPFPPFPP
jgi:hypothetical protein